MAGTLILPQVQVKWGGKNLSAYTLKGSNQPQPIVFDTSVDLPEGGNSWPTGSFSWVPTGPAFKVYEELILKNINDLIEIRFYYVNGPFIRFAFQYNGSDIDYGKGMSVKVLLSCRDAQKSNAARVSAFHDYQKKPVDANQYQKDQQKDFGNVLDIQKTEQAQKDGAQIKVKSSAYKDQTAGALAQNAAKNSGDTLLLHNIGTQGGIVQYTPLTWETKQKSLILETPVGPGKEVDPKKRYGYLLGPGIITTFNRKMEFAAETQTKSSTVTQPGNNPQLKGVKNPPPGSQNTQNTRNQTEAQKAALATQGASSPSVVKGTQFSENKIGPEKQQLLQQEEGVKMSAQMYMCPALVGIKPQDVVFVPSLKIGDKLIEDYKVTSVSYQQQAGTIAVSIQATRTYGLNKPMTGAAADKWLAKADTLKTLEDWQNYAWVERLQ
jgi:hypothetical protein